MINPCLVKFFWIGERYHLLETCSNRSERVPTGSNVFQQVPTGCNVSQQVVTGSNGSQQVPTDSAVFQRVPPNMDTRMCLLFLDFFYCQLCVFVCNKKLSSCPIKTIGTVVSNSTLGLKYIFN